jgi:hypothetical protein
MSGQATPTPEQNLVTLFDYLALLINTAASNTEAIANINQQIATLQQNASTDDPLGDADVQTALQQAAAAAAAATPPAPAAASNAAPVTTPVTPPPASPVTSPTSTDTEPASS